MTGFITKLPAVLAALGTMAFLEATPLSAQVAVVENPSLDRSRRYDDGARWGFVTDKTSRKVAVIDTFLSEGNPHIDTLEFQVIPQELAVSDVQDMIVYIDLETPVLYVYDLVNHEQWSMDLDMVPDAISFHENGATLAVGGENRVSFVEPLTRKHLQTAEDIRSPFTMNFDAGGYNLYITEHDTGNTHIWRAHDNNWTSLQMGDGGPVGEITLSPDARLALVAQESDNSVYIWDLFMDTEFSRYQMSAPVFRPYVSSDSMHVILTTDNGSGVVLDAWGGNVVREIETGEAPRVIRTGWLETIGVIETASQLNVFEIQSDKPVQSLPIAGPLNEVVVVSDSKTLFATQEGSSEVLVLNIRNGEPRMPIETGLNQPNHFAMGLTNTLCN